MKELIEDYKRRLATVTETIETTKDTGSINHVAKMGRLKAKQAEYRTFIAELEQSYHNYITEKLDGLMYDYKADTYGGGSGGVLRALILIVVEFANDMGMVVHIDLTNSTYTIKKLS